MIIGLGTGAMYKLIDPASLEAIEAVRKTGANAIELCGVRSYRFDEGEHSFLNLEPSHLKISNMFLYMLQTIIFIREIKKHIFC